MRIIFRLLCALSLLAPCAAWADPTMIYLVRHGEMEASGKDPALTAQGQARAQNIATILQKAGIGHIFSSDYARTRQTAQRLRSANLRRQNAEGPGGKSEVDGRRGARGGALEYELVRLFGGTAGADIADNEYDRLYQLIVGANGQITTVLLTSIPATGAAP